MLSSFSPPPSFLSILKADLFFVFVCGTQVIITLCLQPLPLLTSSSGRNTGFILYLTVNGELEEECHVEALSGDSVNSTNRQKKNQNKLAEVRSI